MEIKLFMNNLMPNQFTAWGRNGQLVLSLNSEIILPENAPVRLTRLQLKKLDYSKLYAAYLSKGRKSKVDPSVLFQVIAYAYQCGSYSFRKIEEAAATGSIFCGCWTFTTLRIIQT